MSDETRRVESLLAQLTLEEKASLTAGADLWHTRPIPRLGLPALVLSDGPSGARGSSLAEGPSSASFPCGTALAATWNTELVERVGAAIAEDARTKSVNVLLGPTMNLHRTPLGGRNFECYSEDPHLSARTAVAFIRGLQRRGVAACAKHFAANDSEFERMSISSEVGERALRELYLVPFEASVREAGAWSVMSAYNKLNGVYAGEHPWLLRELLKTEWGFDGLVVSDWFGTHSTAEAANAGLDLEMPGPGIHLGAKLVDAVRKSEVGPHVLDDAVRRLLRLAHRTGALDGSHAGPERAVDRPEHRAIARRAAAEAIVLLANSDDALPLEPAELRRIAVIGPNAEHSVVQGGGSARVRPHYVVSALDGIRARAGAGVQIDFAPGCTSHKTTPSLGARLLDGPLRVEYWNGPVAEGAPALVRESRDAYFTWLGAFAPEVDPKAFRVRLGGRITPRESGEFTFSLVSAGKSRLFVDGVLAVDNWTDPRPGEAFFGLGSAEVRADVALEAGRAIELTVEYSNEGRPMLGGLKVGCLPATPPDLLERAVACATGADAAIVVVGLNDEWESEGHDRADLELPGRQVELIERVSAANPRTIVVVNAGAPIRMDWLARVPAVVQLWYPGQECGNALADVLFGDLNPSGRLPQSWPRRIEDTPAFLHYPGESGRVVYGEGLFMGYRYYDTKQVEPLFPFGHGLSYTRFDYTDLRLARNRVAPGERVEVELDVKNTGTRAGQEVVQLYVRDRVSRLARPEQELCAFAKIALEPGETTTVEFTLEPRALSYWDPTLSAFVAEPGEFELRAGASSRDVRARVRFSLEAETP
ncbi:MAG: glycoside hydrolase family 3 C-terminal domain-containing protein [Myxococcota bacterium]